MLRLTLKFPYHGSARFQRYGNSRHLSVRYPQFQKTSLDSTGQNSRKERRGKGGAFFYTVGFLSLAAGGTIAYAKYDPDFREWLKSQAPWTDTVIAVVLQEKKTWNETYSETVEKVTQGSRSLMFWEKEEEKEKKVPSVEKAVRKKEKEVSVDIKPKTEFKVSSDRSNELPETHPFNLIELEKKINDSAALAITAYNDSINAVRGKHAEVMKLIEQTGEGTDESLWQKLKVKSEQGEKYAQEAEQKALTALADVNKLKEIIQDSTFKAPEHMKKAALRSIEKVSEEISKVQAELGEEKRKTCITDKYWKKVYSARQHYLDEIQTLFPNFRIGDKEWNIPQQDLDLFIYYCYRNVLHYQKEVAKLETYGAERLRAAMRESGEKVGKEVVEALIAEELDKRRRDLELEFQKKRLEVEQTVERELRHQLKRQSEAHSDHLTDAIAIREKELEREFLRLQNEKLNAEEDKFKHQLAGMMGRLQGLETALKARVHVDKAAHQAQALWSACQALHFSLRRMEPGIPWQEQLKPLNKEINAVRKAALEDDELVKAVLQGIPQEALERGVYSEAALRDRFLKVEKSARRLALVPEEGASLPVYVLSYLQSILLISSAHPIPQSEIRDEPTQFNNLDTFDILQRARYWMDRGNVDQTLRYMNLLKGASRAVAREWMEEARILLETKQAANVLMTHAAASGLLYI